MWQRLKASLAGLFASKPKPPPEEPIEALAAERSLQFMQRDGRLLLRYVARRADKVFAGNSSVSSGGDRSLAGSDVLPRSHVLAMRPEELAKDQHALELLATTIDDLSRRAAPATVTSIRLTAAYLRVPAEDREPPDDVRKRASRIRGHMRIVIAVAILATIMSILLLAHVDDGQRAIRQLQDSRKEVADVQLRLSGLRPNAWYPNVVQASEETFGIHLGEARTMTRPHRRYCGGDEPTRVPADGDGGEVARALCEAFHQARLREALAFRRMDTWNATTIHWRDVLVGSALAVVSIPYAAICGVADWVLKDFCKRTIAPAFAAARTPGAAVSLYEVPPATDPVALRDYRELYGNIPADDHWRRTELRTSSNISLMTGFLLPLLLGCVGGCAYALRRLDQKLSDWTLEFHDGSHSLLRVLLATMLGGLVGVIWNGDQPVRLEGFALSIAAAAFFIGFSLEVVFSMIEAMVNSVSDKLKGQAAIPVIPYQMPPAAPRARPLADPREGAGTRDPAGQEAAARSQEGAPANPKPDPGVAGQVAVDRKADKPAGG